MRYRHAAGCSEDLRRWFLQNETELFRHRFVHNPPADLDGWLAKHNLNYEAVRNCIRTTELGVMSHSQIVFPVQISREEAAEFSQQLFLAGNARAKHEDR